MNKPTKISNEQTQTEKKICLCMIVKNESKIIERCLNSAKSILDYVSICDTGSTDNTIEIIENWCKANNLPGTVHQQSFKNFGYNRTLSISLAQETYPEADYLLLLDADMLLRVESHFNKNKLHHDLYLTMQYDNQMKYWLTRLLKSSLPWRSVGVTHEYWDLDRPKLGEQADKFVLNQGKIEELIIFDAKDGGSKVDKFERDKNLLLSGINDPFTSPDLKGRYMFYLAQTYLGLNQLEEVIHWYKQRIAAGGWSEELFYALLQIGLCYESLAKKQPSEELLALATLYLEKAWEYRPVRAESIYHLARIHREQSNHNLALLYALRGKEIPYPKDDILFVDYHVYDYLFDFEISISAYYVAGKKHLGQKAMDRLKSMMKRLPPDIIRYIEKNAKFYQ